LRQLDFETFREWLEAFDLRDFLSKVIFKEKSRWRESNDNYLLCNSKQCSKNVSYTISKGHKFYFVFG
jgi:hypothetical protein